MPSEAARWSEQVLRHRFADERLVEQALTHGSSGVVPTYERLEFLGDRVLGLVVAEMLLEVFPEANEGELGRRHAALVQGSLLVEVAAEWQIAGQARMGSGENAPTASVLADMVEAVLGAVYLDAGWDAACGLVRRVWAGKLDKHDGYDPKTRVQEWLQARKMLPPAYEVVGTSGPEHAREFTVEARCDVGVGRGDGPSKQAASMAAAAALWLVIQEEAHG